MTFGTQESPSAVIVLAAGAGTRMKSSLPKVCLLYTSDAADE